ncbi:BamA/TamA family outer membrane protein [Litoribacter ruber]|uniref:BamA/TamA family outer membrane protein n=1 Tax=Litoribacter ruber TaxID=702568 RepID=A0AAP2G4N0_9BACT|nr:BamA/TamA family outer membrane protein [Litoribacter alkaliphilus]MBT0809976.1 BamA/TamA family outer membrane protein [Litoribacter ruber]
MGRAVFILIFCLLSQDLLAQKNKAILHILGPTDSHRAFQDSLERESYILSHVAQLMEQGHLMAKAERVGFHTDTLQVAFHAGMQYHWVELKQGGLPAEVLLKSGFDDRMFNGKVVSYNKVLSLLERIIQASEGQGYPFAEVGLDSLALNGNLLSAGLTYESGPFIAFDTIKITGSSKTDPLFLSKLLQIPPGTPFSQRKIDQSISRVRNLPYLKITEEPSLSFQNSEATFYLPIDDRSINMLDGIIGFLPNELEQNKILVTGQFDLALYNVGGKGRNYALNWQRLSQHSQNLEVSAVEPLILGSNLDVMAQFSFLKQDTSFLNRNFRVDLGYRVSPALYLTFFNSRQAGGLLDVSRFQQAEVLPEAADFRFNNYGVHLDNNRLDDVFFPRRGHFASFEVGVGNKRLLENTALPERLYEDVDMESLQYFIKFNLEKHFYFRPNVGLWTGLRAGLVESNNLLLNDLYRVGGLRSIRGFNENFFFANKFAYLNVEPRFYFDTYSYFMIFADIGRLDNSVGGVHTDWPRAGGAGINLDTGGGMFRFMYALGRSATQPFAFNYSKIHFGYTGRF